MIFLQHVSHVSYDFGVHVQIISVCRERSEFWVLIFSLYSLSVEVMLEITRLCILYFHYSFSLSLSLSLFSLSLSLSRTVEIFSPFQLKLFNLVIHFWQYVFMYEL